MGKKRSKGKVDFKRREDPGRRPLGEEDDKTEEVCHEQNNESEIEVIMKKCKVINSCENKIFNSPSKISRDEATSAHQRFLRRNPDGRLSKEDFIEEATVIERELT